MTETGDGVEVDAVPCLGTRAAWWRVSIANFNSTTFVNDARAEYEETIKNQCVVCEH